MGKFQVALIEVYLKFPKEGEVGSIFKDIMAKIFPNLIFLKKLQIHRHKKLNDNQEKKHEEIYTKAHCNQIARIHW